MLQLDRETLVGFLEEVARVRQSSGSRDQEQGFRKVIVERFLECDDVLRFMRRMARGFGNCFLWDSCKESLHLVVFG